MSTDGKSKSAVAALEQRLLAGPLQVRSLWDDEKTVELPARVLVRRRRQFTIRTALVAAACAGALLFGVPAFKSQALELSDGKSASDKSYAPVARRSDPADAESISLALGDAGQAIYKAPARMVWDEKARVARVEQGAVRFEVDAASKEAIRVYAGASFLQVIRSSFVLRVNNEDTELSVLSGTVSLVTAEREQFLSAGQTTRISQPQVSAEPGLNEPARKNMPGVRASFTNWRKLARDADYQSAYAAIEKRPGIVDSTPNDLMLASDVARQSGHPLQASQLLTRVMSEFPGDARAPLAAFTRGRIQLENLGNPAAAAASFGACRMLSPSGPLAEDALLRQAEASVASGNQGEARRLAQLYLDSYPRGRHRARCEKLIRAD